MGAKQAKRSGPAAKAWSLFRVPILVLALAAACAPRLAPPGPGFTNPSQAMPNLSDSEFLTADGLALPLRVWQPPHDKPRAVILALHGFNDYSKAFEAAGTYWAGEGIATYAYDQRGFGAAPHHGLWAGVPAMTGDLRDSLDLLRGRYPGAPLYLLGDSMGGAVILAASAQDGPLAADGVILVAPAVWARDTMPVLYRASLWLGAHTLPWLKLTGRGLKIQASDNIEMLRALGRDPLIIKATRIGTISGLADLMDAALAAAPKFTAPALLLYGGKDEIVPKDPVLRLWQDLPKTARAHQRRALYNNGWHMLLRDLDAKLVWADIAHWIAQQDTPLPSGAEDRALARLNGGS